ncbi:MAG: nucleotidyltransferase domain-containing protein [Pseudomonadota bacterium]
MKRENALKLLLLSNANRKVLDYLLQNPDQELSDTEIATNIKGAKKSVVNLALRKIADSGITTRVPRGTMVLNRLNETPIVNHLMIVSNLIHIQPLVDKLSASCSKIVLFGSRAKGRNILKSDYDIFVISSKEREIKKIIDKSELSKQIRLIHKHPDKISIFEEDEPVLHDQIKEGIVLWEKM